VIRTLSVIHERQEKGCKGSFHFMKIRVTNFHNKEHILGLTGHSNARSLIRNPFRTKTNPCEGEGKQMNALLRNNFAKR
jgi:hypothetical protein